MSDADTIREALTDMRDYGDRPGMYAQAKRAIAALDRLVAGSAPDPRDAAIEAARIAVPASACDTDGACLVECQDGCVRIKALEVLAALGSEAQEDGGKR